MKYLLDTHTLIWSVTEPGKLSKNVRNLLTDPGSGIVVSAISFWEISLKFSLGKLDINSLKPEDFRNACIDTGFEILDLISETCSTYHQLPTKYHKDPFDRMLIWQAICEHYALISSDENIRKYTSDGLKVIW